MILVIGTIVCTAIPYKNFKEKIRITKKYKHCKIEVYKNFISVKFLSLKNEKFRKIAVPLTPTVRSDRQYRERLPFYFSVHIAIAPHSGR